MKIALVQMIAYAIIPMAVLFYLVRERLDKEAWLKAFLFGIGYGFCWDFLFSQSVWVFQRNVSVGFLGPLPLEEYISLFFMPSLLFFVYLVLPPLQKKGN